MTLKALLTRLRLDLVAAGFPARAATVEQDLSKIDLVTWSQEQKESNALVYHPTVADEDLADADVPEIAKVLAAVVNSAHALGMVVRPIGRHASDPSGDRDPMHNWSPLHLDPDSTADVLYIAWTTISGVLSWDGDRVRTYCGTAVLDVARGLNEAGWWQGAGLWRGQVSVPAAKTATLPSIPGPGNLSVGGVIAIGGHGSRTSNTDGLDWPGTLSATVRALTAIVWDAAAQAFVAKRFSDGDPELPVLAACLGRVPIIDVTLGTAPDYTLKLELVGTSTSTLFSPDPTMPGCFADLASKSAGVEVLCFRSNREEGSRTANVIRWTRTADSPPAWKSNGLADLVGTNNPIVNLIGLAWWTTVAQAAEKEAGRKVAQYADFSRLGTPDLGPAANQRIYVTSHTLRIQPLGLAVVLPRAAVQDLVSTFYHAAMEELDTDEWQFWKWAHVHTAMEVRMANLDDVGLPTGAVPPTLSDCTPVDGIADAVCVWLSILTAQTPLTREKRGTYLSRIEAKVKAMCANRNWTLRPEWSKGWGYTSDGAWTEDTAPLRTFLAAGWPGNDTNPRSFAYAQKVLNDLDPAGTFRASFHKKIGL